MPNWTKVFYNLIGLEYPDPKSSIDTMARTDTIEGHFQDTNLKNIPITPEERATSAYFDSMSEQTEKRFRTFKWRGRKVYRGDDGQYYDANTGENLTGKIVF